jgi:hypothetical protein
VSLGSFGTPLSTEKDRKITHKKQGGGLCFVFDTLSITPVVSGPPFGGMVCLQECRDVVDCSCESAGQSVYGPRIGFLGNFSPFWCKTFGGITSSCVARSIRNVHL